MTELEKRPNIEPVSLGSESREFFVEHSKTAFEIAKMLTGRLVPVYMSGGVVRNLLLGTITSESDYDFIGDFNLDQIEADFPELVVDRWDSVSTIRLKIGSTDYDLTAAKDIREKLSQTDIDISALILSDEGEIFDFFGAIESLSKKEIKVMDPDLKLSSDPSRILRIFRFASELNFTVEEKTLASALRNAHLLKDAKNLDDYLWHIVTMDNEKRTEILKALHNYGIDRYLKFPDNVLEAVNVFELEKEIQRYPQVEEITSMFDAEIFLVGGAVRDLVWGKKINDLDFKIEMPISDIIKKLEENGFEKSPDYHTSEGQYYVSTFTGVVGVVINGLDIHLTEIAKTDLPSLISMGDVNFSCCVYNSKTRKIENPEIIKDIQDKKLYFCNTESANTDPLIVINALKQISRIPDIVTPEETEQIIIDNIPNVIKYFVENPEMSYKLESICGNLNSEEALSYFEMSDTTRELFNNFTHKKSKLSVLGDNYCSQTVEQLLSKDKKEIVDLIRSAFGKKYDSSKEFPDRINSVVFEKTDGKIVSCCLMDGERVYVCSARRGYGWINIFANLAKNNYNVWCTVDSDNPKIQALCSLGGLTLETDPIVMRKILVCKAGKRDDTLEIYEHNGLLVFRDRLKGGYAQVMLRS